MEQYIMLGLLGLVNIFFLYHMFVELRIYKMIDRIWVRLVLDSQPDSEDSEEEEPRINFSKADTESIAPDNGNNHNEELADIIDGSPALKEAPVAIAEPPKTKANVKKKINKKK